MELTRMVLAANVLWSRTGQSFFEEGVDSRQVVLRVLPESYLVECRCLHGHDGSVPWQHLAELRRQDHLSYGGTGGAELLAHLIHQETHARLSHFVKHS